MWLLKIILLFAAGTDCGIMLESNLVAGNQKYQPNEPLTYGQSITDACIDWEETKELLTKLAKIQRQVC